MTVFYSASDDHASGGCGASIAAAEGLAALTQLARRLAGVDAAESALARLDAYGTSFGRDGGDRDLPLPAARLRLEALRAERRRAVTGDEETAADERLALAARKAAIESALAEALRANASQRVAEAERLAGVVAEATKTCFALSGARDFPMERAAEFSRIERRVLDLRAQAERTRATLQEKARHFEREHARIGAGDLGPIDEAWDARIHAAESRTQKLRAQLEAHQAEVDASAQRHAKASRTLENLPDFSRIAADPIEWLHTLANSFQVQRTALAQERKTLDRLKEEMAEYAARLDGPGKLLADMGDVVERARAYEIESRVADQRTGELRSRIESLTASAGEHAANAPASFWMALLMFAAGGGLAAWYRYFPNAGLYVPGILVSCAGLYFVTAGFVARSQTASTRREIDAARDELTRITQESGDRRIAMAKVLEGTGCATPRELEALYDSYRQDSDRHAALAAAYEEQAAKVTEEQRRAADLFDAVRESYRMVGVETESEDDVTSAVTRAVSRYQEYRDAKRRQAEGRDQVSSGSREIEEIREALDEAVEAEVQQSMALRQALRDAGFRDENQHTSAASALRAYRIRYAQAKSGRSRVESLQEELGVLQRQLEIEEQDRNQLEEELNRQLSFAGVASIEEWRLARDEAEAYQAAWSRRAEAQQALDALLDGADLDALRERVRQEGGGTGAAGVEALRAELDGVEAALERAASRTPDGGETVRSLTEIDEDCAAVERHLDRLMAELEAVGLAASAIEESASAVQSRLAASWSARLAETAGESGSGVRIAEDLTVAAPAESDAEGLLVAACAALAAALSEDGPPLGLDEPFAELSGEALDAALAAAAGLNGAGRVVLRSARPEFAEAAARAGLRELAE